MTYSGLLSLILVDLSLMYDCLSIRTNLFTSGLATSDVDCCSSGSDALGRGRLGYVDLTRFCTVCSSGTNSMGLRRTAISLHHHLLGCR